MFITIKNIKAVKKKIILLLIFLTTSVVAIASWSYINREYQKTTEEVNHQLTFLQPTPTLQFQPQSVSLNQIFSDDHSWTATLSARKVRTLIATGDVIPARSVNFQTVTKNNFLWPYEKTAEVLKNANTTFINLETPLISNCPLTNTGMIFCGDIRNLEGLRFAGIDVVSLANNHTSNWGIEGIKNTVKVLNEAEILTTGVTSIIASPSANTVFKNIRGLSFAFLGYNDIVPQSPGISWADENKIQLEINQARQKSDVVVVAFHWGIEYISQPTQRQKDLAHLAIDSGADLIIGNHPHWIQPIEIYKGKVIVYAHGNFVFDQMWSQKTREGVVGRYTFYENKLIDVEFLPIQIDQYGQPHFIDNNQKGFILDEMKKGS